MNYLVKTSVNAVSEQCELCLLYMGSSSIRLTHIWKVHKSKVLQIELSGQLLGKLSCY